MAGPPALSHRQKYKELCLLLRCLLRCLHHQDVCHIPQNFCPSTKTSVPGAEMSLEIRTGRKHGAVISHFGRAHGSSPLFQASTTNGVCRSKALVVFQLHIFIQNVARKQSEILTLTLHALGSAVLAITSRLRTLEKRYISQLAAKSGTSAVDQTSLRAMNPSLQR